MNDERTFAGKQGAVRANVQTPPEFILHLILFLFIFQESS